MLAALVLAAVVAHPAVYRIDPAAAEAGFTLEATMHTVHGVTTHVLGEVRVEPESGGALKLNGRIEIGAATLATGNSRRDATMHDKSLLVASFPTIVFTAERFDPAGPEGAGGVSEGALTGRITIRGRTKPQSMKATLSPRGDRIVASGTFDVAWAEFGIPDPSFFVVTIEAVAHAHFRAEFVPAP